MIERERERERDKWVIVDTQSLILITFVEVLKLFCMSSNYGVIRKLLQGLLPTQSEEEPWVDWCLGGKIQYLQVTSSILYQCSIKSSKWLSSKEEKMEGTKFGL